MKAMLRACGCRLEANGDAGLVREVLAYRRNEHAASATDEKLVGRVVAENAYKLEYAAPYADGEGPDEEFGPEPY